MPWLPELFSAPALAQIKEKHRRDELVAVPFFDGLLIGEPDAVLGSFADEPEVHDPVRGRVKGTRAFEEFIARMTAWLGERNGSVEDVAFLVVTGGAAFGEVVLHFDGDAGRVGLPLAILADRRADGRITELRMYSSTEPLTGRLGHRPPLLQADPAVRLSGVVAEYQRALAAGDVDAVVALFEPDGYARELAGGEDVHRGAEALRGYYERLFSDGGGGIRLQHCALVDDGRTCVLEFNVVRWGGTELPPAAGLGVYARGPSGKLAAVRVYMDPPLA